jgi:hypothetical protein
MDMVTVIVLKKETHKLFGTIEKSMWVARLPRNGLKRTLYFNTQMLESTEYSVGN